MRAAFTAVLSACVLPLAAVAADFATAGPEAVEQRTFVTVEVDGARLTSEVWFPAAAGARPGVALLHGFASDRFTVASVGRHLASWGFVVVAPNLPSAFAPDAVRNARLARAIVDVWLPARSADAGSYLAGRVAAGRTGVVGHSAGGLASVLALKDAPPGSRAAGVLLDWVDSAASPFGGQPADLGKNALPSVWAPAAFLFAEPGSCNAQGNGVAPSATSAGPRLQLKVAGATHCDPGDPAAFGCTSVCGGFDAARASLFLGYGTAWLRRWLLHDPDTDAWLGGDTFDAHVADGRITGASVSDFEPLAGVDAGTPEPDAGTVVVAAGAEAPVEDVDAGDVAPVDAGEARDAGARDALDAGSEGAANEDPEGPDAPVGGCECGAATTGVYALLPLLRRRRSA